MHRCNCYLCQGCISLQVSRSRYTSKISLAVSAAFLPFCGQASSSFLLLSSPLLFPSSSSGFFPLQSIEGSGISRRVFFSAVQALKMESESFCLFSLLSFLSSFSRSREISIQGVSCPLSSVPRQPVSRCFSIPSRTREEARSARSAPTAIGSNAVEPATRTRLAIR